MPKLIMSRRRAGEGTVRAYVYTLEQDLTHPVDALDDRTQPRRVERLAGMRGDELGHRPELIGQVGHARFAAVLGNMDDKEVLAEVAGQVLDHCQASGARRRGRDEKVGVRHDSL